MTPIFLFLLRRRVRRILRKISNIVATYRRNRLFTSPNIDRIIIAPSTAERTIEIESRFLSARYRISRRGADIWPIPIPPPSPFHFRLHCVLFQRRRAVYRARCLSVGRSCIRMAAVQFRPPPLSALHLASQYVASFSQRRAVSIPPALSLFLGRSACRRKTR